uniref:Uncharacterized protein n=1 Tax=Siphoviridae sp. ct5jB2 TaxID=2825337 RepID=A0A8S5TTU3_9CAUD|nr:MAG TPA: hypothetical protein [Siphoviridae sp. ct5jB2]
MEDSIALRMKLVKLILAINQKAIRVRYHQYL